MSTQMCARCFAQVSCSSRLFMFAHEDNKGKRPGSTGVGRAFAQKPFKAGAVSSEPQMQCNCGARRGAQALRGANQNRLSSPYLTLQRSWMLCDRAFGQLASTCRSSGNLASPYFSMSRATLYRPRRPQGSHSIERVGTRKSERGWARRGC
jgi:hypothetical protein